MCCGCLEGGQKSIMNFVQGSGGAIKSSGWDTLNYDGISSTPQAPLMCSPINFCPLLLKAYHIICEDLFTSLQIYLVLTNN